MKKKMELFLKRHKKKMKEPVIRVFLMDKINKKIFENYINNPSIENKNILDRAFQEHYRDARLKSYVSKLIYFYSIDFDKKVNIRNRRQLLVNHNSNEDGDITVYNNLISSKEDKTFLHYKQKQTKLKDHLTDEKVIEALSELSDKQAIILDLAYVFNMSNKEISDFLNESPQTISYNHKAALNKIKKQYLFLNETDTVDNH